MYKIWFLVWIWKRSRLGFWYKAPVVRIAHADRAGARRLGRLFTFEDLFEVAITTIGTAATSIGVIEYNPVRSQVKSGLSKPGYITREKKATLSTKFNRKTL